MLLSAALRALTGKAQKGERTAAPAQEGACCGVSAVWGMVRMEDSFLLLSAPFSSVCMSEDSVCGTSADLL